MRRRQVAGLQGPFAAITLIWRPACAVTLVVFWLLYKWGGPGHTGFRVLLAFLAGVFVGLAKEFGDYAQVCMLLLPSGRLQLC